MTGNHFAVSVSDLGAAKNWYAEKLDFRVVTEWLFGDLNPAYLSPAADDNFLLEIVGGASRAKGRSIPIWETACVIPVITTHA